MGHFEFQRIDEIRCKPTVYKVGRKKLNVNE